MSKKPFPKLVLDRRPTGWWIECVNRADIPDHGPYTTRREADTDRQGLKSFYRNRNKPGWATTER